MPKPTYRVVQGDEPTAPMGEVKLRCGSLDGAKKAARSHAKRLPYQDVVSVYRELPTPGQFELVYDLNSELRG